MANNGQEIEAKFYVRDLRKIQLQLQDLGARLIQSRVLETNLRFDLPGAQLRSERRVLRLRRDTEARLTYKSASTNEQGALSRSEIEFTVGDFEKAKEFLEALGYQPIFIYEKYRMTYILEAAGISPESHEEDRNPQGCLIMLDELPYGNFIEIEGETIESIRQVSDALRLDWDTAIATSYYTLFERVCKSLDRSFQNLLFKDLSGVQVTAAHLGVRAADELR